MACEWGTSLWQVKTSTKVCFLRIADEIHFKTCKTKEKVQN